MINNRQQNGRRRGRGGNNGGGGGGTGGGGGGGPRQGGQGRGDNGNRIDSRARGNASQLLEKYKNLASDSQRQGDRVNTEYYLQFADHYFRVLADQRGRVEDNQARRQQRDEFDADGDEYYGDEGEPMRAGELQQPQTQQTQLQQPQSQQGDDGQGDRQGNYRRERGERDRPERGERPERPERTVAAGGNGERQDRNEGDQPRPPRNWEARPEREPRGDRDQAPRRARPERDQQAEQPTPRQPDQQPAQPDFIEQAGTAANEEAPRRRGRPRRDAVVESTESVGSGFEPDRLPPSLGISAVTNDGDDAAPKPRRRRVAARPSEVPTAAE